MLYHYRIITKKVKKTKLDEESLTGELERTKKILQKEIVLRKKAELKLLKTTNVINNILGTIDEGVIAYDKNLRYIYMNKKAEKILQVKCADVIGMTREEVFPNGIEKELSNRFEEAVKNRKHESFEVYFKPLNKWIAVKIFPTKQGAVGYLQDLTKQKNTENLVKEGEFRFKKLLEANIIGIAIVDKNGNILESNDKFLDMVCYTRDELLQTPKIWNKIFINNTNKTIKAENVSKEKTFGPIEQEYLRKDGDKIPTLMTYITLDNKSKMAMGLVLDITERKELEERKNTFFTIASHELKTPIAIIKATNQALMEITKESNHIEALEYIDNMNQQLTKLDKLITDILTLNKIQLNQLEYLKSWFSFDKLVEEIIETIHPILNSHEIVFEGKTNKKVFADKYRVEQVIINLIENAIKYSPHKKKIIIKLKAKKHAVVLSVKDFGIGIPLSNQNRIFEKFYRGQNSKNILFNGLGIGLFISQTIVQKHKGKLYFKSIESKGSTFFIELPLASA